MIKFYKTNNDFGIFSNFYVSNMFIDGKWWKSVEHYYQAMKTLDIDEQEYIRKIDKCNNARLAGQKVTLRPDFDNAKNGMMMRGLEAKFSQNKNLQNMLLATGHEEIIEDSPVDNYWGCGKDGDGKNMLGKLLMDLRDKLREK